jgi:hypothetical protein
MDALYLALGDLSREQLETGLRKFYRTRKEIYPNTNLGAVIRELALVDNLQYPTSAEAWEMVRREMARVGGSYGTPAVPIAPVQKAIETISWREICLSENPEAVRAHFFKVYDALVKRSQDLALENDVVNELAKRLDAGRAGKGGKALEEKPG